MTDNRILTTVIGKQTRMAITDPQGAEPAIAILNDNSDHIRLERIYLDPEMRNCGIGAHLMRAVIEKCGSREIRLSVGSIDDNNEETDPQEPMDENALVKYYERFGFKSIGAKDIYSMVRLPDQTQ